MRRHNPHRGSPPDPLAAKGEKIRSPQVAQIWPDIGSMPSRHSRQTGSRPIVNSGALQIRQSEGNNTAKRLSARSRAQGRAMWAKWTGESTLREAIERLAPAALAW